MLKRILLLLCTLMLVVNGASAQTDVPEWKRYTVKDERFSVALPAEPIVEFRRIARDSRGERLEITLGAFAEGVVYVVHVFENLSPRQSLDSFINERSNSGQRFNRKTQSKLTLEGVTGKTFRFNGIEGTIQFFSQANRLFQFTAVGAPQDDERITRFFSSISLVDKKAGSEVFEPKWPPIGAPSVTAEPEPVFTPKEVDKSFKVVMSSHAEYTELARQHQVTGTVILKCTLDSHGHVSTIRVLSGLPFGLTEGAIAAARRLKFIPAMKDGKYVSVSTQFVYTFDLF